MDDLTFSFRAEVWEHSGGAAWHFLSLPPEVTDEIDDAMAGRKNGFGSVRVSVTIGASSWETSVFPDTKRGCFVLPVKKAVRLAEGLAAGDAADVRLRVVEVTDRPA